VLLPNPFEVLYTPSLMDISKLGLVPAPGNINNVSA
jgi:hypothetical protein